MRRFLPKPSPLRYWEERARRYGARSVVHIGHGDDEIAAVTEKQKRILLPLLRQRLRGDDRWLLDLGCGPGRFTADLADAIGGRALGLDPIEHLLRLAPGSSATSYVRACAEPLPLADNSVDVVWICLVLGGIVDDEELARTALEVRRVLKPGGLLFLVENTSEKPDGDYWRYRGVEGWRELFRLPSLEHVSDYEDMEEHNSVLCVRIP